MAEILKRNKALSVSPLKSSQPVGGALATLGFGGAMPMLHGSQGCTAFAKVFFVRHFREPIPLQTTAMNQVSTVMDADASVVEGLRAICEKSRPTLITVLTTGLSETQGTDIKRAVKEFRAAHPEYAEVAVVGVNTPDYDGGLEAGYAVTVTAILDALVPEAAGAGTRPCRNARQVNVLAGSLLTPGDIEYLVETIEAFGLEPLVVPDLSGSLDGHLPDGEFSPVTTGGTRVARLANLGDAAATLVIGASLTKAAVLLKERTGVPDYRFDHLHGLRAYDDFVMALREISGRDVPSRLTRHRAQLQDALLDTHFMIGQTRVAIAADPDLLGAFARLVVDSGAEVVAAVTSGRAPVLERVPAASVKIGDLQDLEQMARDASSRRSGSAANVCPPDTERDFAAEPLLQGDGVDLVIGSSHALAAAERLGAPLLRTGFPLYDRVGAYCRTWIGYRGGRDALFEIANLLLANHSRHEIAPYVSVYAQKADRNAA